jgi:hypothetical protein
LNIEASEEVIMEKFLSVATRPIKGKESAQLLKKMRGKG